MFGYGTGVLTATTDPDNLDAGAVTALVVRPVQSLMEPESTSIMPMAHRSPTRATTPSGRFRRLLTASTYP